MLGSSKGFTATSNAQCFTNFCGMRSISISRYDKIISVYFYFFNAQCFTNFCGMKSISRYEKIISVYFVVHKIVCQGFLDFSTSPTEDLLYSPAAKNISFQHFANILLAVGFLFRSMEAASVQFQAGKWQQLAASRKMDEQLAGRSFRS